MILAAFRVRSLLAAPLVVALAGCSHARGAEEERERANVQDAMKTFIGDQVASWLSATRALAEHAPVPNDRGWSATLDRAAIAAMKKDWEAARWAYERVEGAVAPMFPESDTATDARYDDFLMTLGAAGDPNAFDDRGVVGMHAVERVLWADAMPPEVAKFERGIPGYRAARFPENATDALDFKQKLAGRLVLDVEKLEREFSPLALDIAFAFRGLVDLAAEQVEKVDRAATGQEESRYAQATLRDLRANREGCLLA
ncbi:MAG TPA: imelysin family protein, partial [Polyangiaceae bacterium]